MFSLIEGIGSDQGLLEPIAIQEPPGMLVCFKENGHTIYPAGVDSCPLTTAVQNHRQSLQIPTIYPDPADRFLNINIDNPSNSNFILLIYNTLGDLLSSNTVNGNSFKLDISSFSTSVYFYRLIESTSKQVYTGKFIKD